MRSSLLLLALAGTVAAYKGGETPSPASTDDDCSQRVVRLEYALADARTKQEDVAQLRLELEKAKKASVHLQTMVDRQTRDTDNLKESKDSLGDGGGEEEEEEEDEEIRALKEARDSLEDEYELMKSRAEVQATELDEVKAKLDETNERLLRLQQMQTNHEDEMNALNLKFGIAVASVILLLVHEVYLFKRKRPSRKRKQGGGDGGGGKETKKKT